VRHRSRVGHLAHRGALVIHRVAVLPHVLLRHLAQWSIWEQLWTAAAFGLAALTAVAAPLWWRRRCRLHNRSMRHVRFALTAGATAGFVSAVLAVAVAVNWYAGYAPSLGALWGSAPARTLPSIGGSPTVAAGPAGGLAGLSGAAVTQSMVVRLTLSAHDLHIGSRQMYVYLPPGYFAPRDADIRYPVLYLLHGYPGRASDWLLGGNLRRAMDTLIHARLIRPMIVAMPQDSNGVFDDSECLDLPDEQDETYLTDRVVSLVDRTFRTIRSREARAIGGMSAGAFCALNLGLRHLDEYSVILASQPYADPGRSLVDRVGGRAAWLANSPSAYLPTMELPLPVAVFLDAGARDGETLPTARWLAAAFARRGEYVAMRVAPGQTHSWTAARMELPYALVFAAQHLAAPTGHSRREA
jgi:enterochelin esterase-like enzyme